MTNNKSFTSKFFYLLLILLFTFEVINFGPNSVEQYSLGLYSTKFFWNSSNLFSSFNDFIGPGAKMPLGSGPFLHPLNFFIKEVKLYFFLFILCHLIIQIEFTKKVIHDKEYCDQTEVAKKLIDYYASVTNYYCCLGRHQQFLIKRKANEINYRTFRRQT